MAPVADPGAWHARRPLVALLLSGFSMQSRWRIKIVSVTFILRWAVPSIPAISSSRFMRRPRPRCASPTMRQAAGGIRSVSHVYALFAALQQLMRA
ncbi:hypothetical protein D5047_02775 [Verminephrobacter eiseniae]|nr:hypothetical protein [Verminephrobacter eiseniae]